MNNTIKRNKALLANLGLYNGQIDDVVNEEYMSALQSYTGLPQQQFGGNVLKWQANAFLSPFEHIAGRDFYNPEYEGKYADQFETADDIFSGISGLTTDIAGSALLGPAYGLGKSAVRTGVNLADRDKSWEKVDENGPVWSDAVGKGIRGASDMVGTSIGGGLGGGVGVLGKSTDFIAPTGQTTTTLNSLGKLSTNVSPYASSINSGLSMVGNSALKPKEDKANQEPAQKYTTSYDMQKNIYGAFKTGGELGVNPKIRLFGNAKKVNETKGIFEFSGDQHGEDTDNDGKEGIPISMDGSPKPVAEIENGEIYFKGSIISDFIGVNGKRAGKNNPSAASLARPAVAALKKIQDNRFDRYGKNTAPNLESFIEQIYNKQEAGKKKQEFIKGIESGKLDFNTVMQSMQPDPNATPSMPVTQDQMTAAQVRGGVSPDTKVMPIQQMGGRLPEFMQRMMHGGKCFSCGGKLMQDGGGLSEERLNSERVSSVTDKQLLYQPTKAKKANWGVVMSDTEAKRQGVSNVRVDPETVEYNDARGLLEKAITYRPIDYNWGMTFPLLINQ